MLKLGRIVLVMGIVLGLMTVAVYAEVIEDDFSDPSASKALWKLAGESEAFFNKGYVLLEEAKPGKDFNRIFIDRSFKNPQIEVELRFPKQNLNSDNHAGIILSTDVDGANKKQVFIRRFHKFLSYVDFAVEPIAELWPIQGIEFAGEGWHTLKLVVKDETLQIYLDDVDAGTYDIGQNEFYISLYSNQINAEFRRVRIEEL